MSLTASYIHNLVRIQVPTTDTLTHTHTHTYTPTHAYTQIHTLPPTNTHRYTRTHTYRDITPDRPTHNIICMFIMKPYPSLAFSVDLKTGLMVSFHFL